MHLIVSLNPSRYRNVARLLVALLIASIRVFVSTNKLIDPVAQCLCVGESAFADPCKAWSEWHAAGFGIEENCKTISDACQLVNHGYSWLIMDYVYE